MPTPTPIRLLSSMATQPVLAALTAQYQRKTGTAVVLESVGGVDAARRVQAGEAVDAVVLAAKALQQLIDGGSVVAGSRVDLAHSGVAVAVRAGAPQPAIDDEQAVKQAVLAARTVGFSTGPSGVHLLQLFQRWGIAEQMADRTVQVPPGVPVGQLLASGEAELGFQQLTELLQVGGITVLGPLPPALQVMTTFSGGIATASQQPDAVRELLAFMASVDATAAKQDNGMEPA